LGAETLETITYHHVKKSCNNNVKAELDEVLELQSRHLRAEQLQQERDLL